MTKKNRRLITVYLSDIGFCTRDAEIRDNLRQIRRTRNVTLCTADIRDSVYWHMPLTRHLFNITASDIKPENSTN